MSKSLSQEWFDVYMKCIDLEQKVRKLVDQGPKEVLEAHRTAVSDVQYISLAVSEIRSAIKVWEDNRQSLDECTEQELARSKLRHFSVCNECGLEMREDEAHVHVCQMR